MGIIKDFSEYENLHDLREHHSLQDLASHPRIKELRIMEDIINEGYFGDLISGWKDALLNAITKKIPGAAMNRISKLLARYDKEFYQPKIDQEIKILEERYKNLYGDKKSMSDEEKKTTERDPNFNLKKDVWARRIDANKKKWQAKENELSTEKKSLQAKYKDNPRITKAFDLAAAQLEFKRYKEAEEKYSSLLVSPEEKDAFTGDLAEKGKKAEVAKKEATAEVKGKEGEEGEEIDDKNVKVGQVWQTKDGKDVTISMDLEDSKKRIAELKTKGADIKKRGFIAKYTVDGEEKEVIVPVGELVALKQEAEKTSTEKLKEIEDKIKKNEEERGLSKPDDPKLKDLNIEAFKLKIQKVELEKKEGWEKEKEKYEEKIKMIEKGEEDPEEKSKELKKEIEKKSGEKEQFEKGTPERRKAYIEELKLRIEKAKLDKQEDLIADFEDQIKKTEAAGIPKKYEKGSKITYVRRSGKLKGQENTVTVVKDDPERPEHLMVKGNKGPFEISKDQIVDKKEEEE